MKVIKRGEGYVVLEDGNLVPTCHTYYLNDGDILVRDGREIWNIPNEKWVNAEKNLPMIAFCAMPNNYGTLDEISEKYAMELIVSYRQEKIETDTLTPEQKHAALKKRFLEDDLAAEYAKSYGYFHTRDGVNEDV